MANRVINYRAGSDNVITVTIDGIDLSDGGGTKTVTANIFTDRSPSEVTNINSGITVTQTGDPSVVTISPNATLKALSNGVYAIEFLATDSASDVEYTDPPIQLNIVSVS